MLESESNSLLKTFTSLRPLDDNGEELDVDVVGGCCFACSFSLCVRNQARISHPFMPVISVSKCLLGALVSSPQSHQVSPDQKNGKNSMNPENLLIM